MIITDYMTKFERMKLVRELYRYILIRSIKRYFAEKIYKIKKLIIKKNNTRSYSEYLPRQGK